MLFLSFLLTTVAVRTDALTPTWNPTTSQDTGISPPGDLYYTYAPSIVQDSATTRKVFYCGNAQSGHPIVDHVMMQSGTKGPDDQYTWSGLTDALAPGPAGAWDSAHVCDPEVVRGQFQWGNEVYGWAMFYLGVDTPDGKRNEIGVAYAQDITGPWVKWPSPLIPWTEADGCSQCWGTGQPSATSVNGAGNLMLFYTIGGSNGTRTVRRQIDLSNVTSPVLGVPAQLPTNGLTGKLDLHNASFAYDGTRDRFVIAREGLGPPQDSHPNYVSTTVQVASMPGANIWGASGTWTVLKDIGPCLSGMPRNHNPGVVRNIYGGLVDGSSLEVYYTVASEGGETPEWSYRMKRAASPLAFVTQDRPAVATEADGRVTVFGREQDRCESRVWRNPEAAPNGAATEWSSVGTSPPGSPAAARNADGRVQLFARGSDGYVWTNPENAANGNFSGWSPIEPGAAHQSVVGNPVPFANTDGTISVVVRRSDNYLLLLRQTAADGAFPSTWTVLGPAPPNDPSVGFDANGRAILVAKGSNGHVWINPQNTDQGGTFWGWSDLGVPAGKTTFDGSAPVVGLNQNGTLVVFGVTNGAEVWSKTQTTADGPFSSVWVSLGASPPGDPVVMASQNGKLTLAARGSDGAVWWNRQQTLNGPFGGWAKIQSYVTHDPVLARDADGSLLIIARGGDGAVYRSREAYPNAGFEYVSFSQMP